MRYAPIISPGPTNPWALHTPTPHSPRGAPLGCPHGLACPLPRVRATLCHLNSTWARPALPSGLACRVASARVPRATSAPRSCGNKPPFCNFRDQLKTKINSGKIHKNLRNSKIHNLRNTTHFEFKFSPLDHKFLHL